MRNGPLMKVCLAAALVLLASCGGREEESALTRNFCPRDFAAVRSGVNSAPYAYYQLLQAEEGQPLEIVLYACDPDHPDSYQGLSWEVQQPPAHGDLSAYSGTYPDAVITYTPLSAAALTDGFSFTVSDGEFTSNLAEVRVQLHGLLYFPGDDGTAAGGEPWSYDPALDSFSLVADVNPSSVSEPADFTRMGGQLYFTASDPVQGRELWVHDPVLGTTVMAADINTFPGYGSYPHDLTPVGGRLYLAAEDAEHGDELFVYDPALEAASLVADMRTTLNYGSYPSDLTVLDGRLYFSALLDLYTAHQELYCYDPLLDAVSLAADVRTAPGSGSYPYGLTVLDGRLYFSASHDLYGNELWVYDPDTGEASLAADILSGTGDYSYPGEPVPLEGKLYFSAYSGSNWRDNELWVYDPAVSDPLASAVKAADIGSGIASSYPSELTPLGGRLYFSAETAGSGRELWAYDPLLGAAAQVADINTSPGEGGAPEYLRVLGDRLYFAAWDGTHGYELWVYDPSDGSTRMLGDLNPGAGSGYFLPMEYDVMETARGVLTSKEGL